MQMQTFKVKLAKGGVRLLIELGLVAAAVTFVAAIALPWPAVLRVVGL